MNAAERHRNRQRRRSLEFAREIRTRRAELRASIEAGDAALQWTIAEPPSWMQTVKVLDALPWVPGIGSVAAEEIVDSLALDPWAEFGRLNVRERLALMHELDARVKDGRIA